jgi:type III secretion protein J
MSTRFIVFLFATSLLGCSTSAVAAGLDEPQANRVVVALDRAKIDATKEVDPSAEGKFRVVVGADDATQAIERLDMEDLPRARPVGVLDSMEKGALVPSQAAEHAQLVAGLQGDLERTLEGVSGVLSARVHLNLPVPDPLRDTTPSKATASVLLEHQGATPPLTIQAVQSLLVGGVGGLVHNDVQVVMVSKPTPAIAVIAPLTHFGPLRLAPGSARLLRIGVTCLIVVGLLVLWAISAMHRQIRRLRAELAQREEGKEG